MILWASGRRTSAATQISVGSGLWLLTVAGTAAAATVALIIITRYRSANR